MCPSTHQVAVEQVAVQRVQPLAVCLVPFVSQVGVQTQPPTHPPTHARTRQVEAVGTLLHQQQQHLRVLSAAAPARWRRLA